MFNVKRLAKFLATGEMPEMTALDESLAEHDKKYHGGKFDPDNMTCGKRDAQKNQDKLDEVGKVEHRRNDEINTDDIPYIEKDEDVVPAISKKLGRDLTKEEKGQIDETLKYHHDHAEQGGAPRNLIVNNAISVFRGNGKYVLVENRSGGYKGPRNYYQGSTYHGYGLDKATLFDSKEEAEKFAERLGQKSLVSMKYEDAPDQDKIELAKLF